MRPEDASPGFLCPEYAIVSAIPVCNVCIHRGEPGECKKLGKRPMELRNSEHRNCDYAEIDTECFSFRRFSELYPEDTKRLLERRAGQNEEMQGK